MVQVDPSKCRVPSHSRRAALVFLHTFLPYCLDKLLVYLENDLQAEHLELHTSPGEPGHWWSPASYVRAQIRRLVRLLTEPQRKALLPMLLMFQQTVTLLHRFHVAIFYLSGTFYHLSKRATGITYVSD